MAYSINSNCINCGACLSECPVDAIRDSDSSPVINPDRCMDCGTCSAVCPTNAINSSDL